MRQESNSPSHSVVFRALNARMEIVEEPRLPRGLKGLLHMPNATVITYGSGTRRQDFVCGAVEKKNRVFKYRGRRARA